MGRPDWRAMLAGMTFTDYAAWLRFYRTHFFQDTQLDMHFFGLAYSVPLCLIHICRFRRYAIGSFHK
ncbi:hypothetical protein AGA25_25130, partial [Escherichia coli]